MGVKGCGIDPVFVPELKDLPRHRSGHEKSDIIQHSIIVGGLYETNGNLVRVMCAPDSRGCHNSM